MTYASHETGRYGSMTHFQCMHSPSTCLPWIKHTNAKAFCAWASTTTRTMSAGSLAVLESRTISQSTSINTLDLSQTCSSSSAFSSLLAESISSTSLESADYNPRKAISSLPPLVPKPIHIDLVPLNGAPKDSFKRISSEISVLVSSPIAPRVRQIPKAHIRVGHWAVGSSTFFPKAWYLMHNSLD
jgi:hypothetical protein